MGRCGRDAGNGELREEGSDMCGGEMSNRNVSGGEVSDTRWSDG